MPDNQTSREFIALLPMTLQLGDLSNREKYGSLPKTLVDKEGRQTNYEVGDLAYWTPVFFSVGKMMSMDLLL